ncbi:hypothetical protein KIPB_013819, partial [Kipferlia bialata]|eukprot:g13819.t1
MTRTSVDHDLRETGLEERLREQEQEKLAQLKALEDRRVTEIDARCAEIEARFKQQLR